MTLLLASNSYAANLPTCL